MKDSARLDREILAAGATAEGAWATDVEGIKREFRVSIDTYLEVCAERGIEPRAPQLLPQGARA